MNIAWDQFTPWSALAGGLLIGLSVAMFVLGNGRVAGIAGLVGGALQSLWRRQPLAGQGVRFAFIAGLLFAPWAWRVFAPLPGASVDVGPAALVLAGLLVGFGVRMGSGCTSGHGVCGLSRFSPRSMVNTLAFMAAGFAVVFVLRHLWSAA